MSFQTTCQTLFDHYVACYRQGDAAGCASVFAETAELFSPYGPPAIGQKAIAATHAEWLADGGETKDIAVTAAGQDGALGWCTATFSENGIVEGHSLNVMQRQPDGSWCILRCSLTEV